MILPGTIRKLHNADECVYIVRVPASSLMGLALPATLEAFATFDGAHKAQCRLVQMFHVPIAIERHKARALVDAYDIASGSPSLADDARLTIGEVLS